MSSRIWHRFAFIGLAILLAGALTASIVGVGGAVEQRSTDSISTVDLTFAGGGCPLCIDCPIEQVMSYFGQMSTLEGAIYDGERERLFIFGIPRGADSPAGSSLPGIDRDAFVIALRSVYRDPYPGVTIGTRPSPDRSVQLVDYFGGVEGTHFGSVLFESDRLLKTYSMGIDNLTGEPIVSTVEGYVSETDRWIGYEQQNPTGGSYVTHREWFTPSLKLRQSTDGNTILFDDVQMVLNWEYIPPTASGNPNITKAADDFVAHFQSHYDEFAAEQLQRENTALTELKQLSAVTGIVKWLREKELNLDVGHYDSYQPAQVATASTTPAITDTRTVGNFIFSVYGGVDVNPAFLMVTDPNVNPIADYVRSSQPSPSADVYLTRRCTVVLQKSRVSENDSLPRRTVWQTNSYVLYLPLLLRNEQPPNYLVILLPVPLFRPRATVHIINDTDCTLSLSLSGPDNVHISIPPRERQTIVIPEGTYSYTASACGATLSGTKTFEGESTWRFFFGGSLQQSVTSPAPLGPSRLPEIIIVNEIQQR